MVNLGILVNGNMQKVKIYQATSTNSSGVINNSIESSIQEEISNGWKVKSIVPTLTEYRLVVAVLFEK